ncbi:unnamed protein product [Alopecurus aequalis]
MLRNARKTRLPHVICIFTINDTKFCCIVSFFPFLIILYIVNAESTWGQYFRNAELEKMLNQDLSRLYPELGEFFQTATCQSMLERILLVWSLRYPEFGYKQGMHELLAPLLYVLHVDVQHFKQVRGLHEELFGDDFAGQTFLDRPKLNRSDRTNNFESSAAKIRSLDDLDPDTRDLLLINDAYGAEGELGIISSEKFMEHDAYCMFENLMNGLVNGEQGVVAITDFYSLSPAPESSTGLTPVREASSAIYHLLASVDSSLHSHLVELGVEPQYFALRWLRVLFGREFSLDKLLFIWDEIFSSPNHSYCTEIKSRGDYQFKVLCSPRGALILSMAVSMMLHLRSSLLGSEHATSCLVRLLNFPDDIDLKNLIEKAKLLQSFALEQNLPSSPLTGKPPLTPPNYWEETWKTLQMSVDKRSGDPIVKMKGRGLFRSVSDTESNVSRTKDANFENSNLTSTSQSIVDEPHNADIVPVNLINSSPPMPIEQRKDFATQHILDLVRSSSNSPCEGGLHDVGYTTPVETRNHIEAAREYIRKVQPSLLRRRTASDLDRRNVEEPCVSHDVKVVQEPDPLSVHSSTIDEPRQVNGKMDEAAVTNQTFESVDYQPIPEHRPCFDVGPSLNVVDKDLAETLRSLGESMVENVQVIELFFQPNLRLASEENVPGSTEQAKALAALEELRKISYRLRRI